MPVVEGKLYSVDKQSMTKKMTPVKYLKKNSL